MKQTPKTQLLTDVHPPKRNRPVSQRPTTPRVIDGVVHRRVTRSTASQLLLSDSPLVIPATASDAFNTAQVDQVAIQPSQPQQFGPQKQLADTATVHEHLLELRRRAQWSMLALAAGGLLGYWQHNRIIAILVKPLQQQLYYTSPTGGFDFLIKVCLFFGFLLAVPVVTYQLLRFMAPAMPKSVSHLTGKLLCTSTVLALLGVSFAYFISLPAALHFLSNFNNDQVQSLISANEYFNFVMIYLAGFAALFQMPLLFSFINRIKPMSPKTLMKQQRLVIVASFILAAILTPTPDPLNQTLMALPMVALYQSSVGIVWQSDRKAKKQSNRAPIGAMNFA